jgi:hypothetical protein
MVRHDSTQDRLDESSVATGHGFAVSAQIGDPRHPLAGLGLGCVQPSVSGQTAAVSQLADV